VSELSTKPGAELTTKPRATIQKSVRFTWVDGQWCAEVELTDPTVPFTERDFNQLSILLNVKRAEIRRKSYIIYRKLTQDLERAKELKRTGK